MTRELQGPRGDQRWTSFGHLLTDAADRHAGTLAIVDGDVRLRYDELAAYARRFGRAMVSAGVDRGDRVAIWAPNSARFVAAALGAQLAGAAIVPINTRYRGHETKHILDRAAPKLLLVANGFLDMDCVELLTTAGHDLAAGPTIVDLGPGRDARTTPVVEFLASGADADDVLDGRIAELRGDDLSDVMFTSGTTGRPKGVMTTHAQNLRAYYDWSRLAGMRAGDRYAIVNPFFHAFGYKVGWLASLMHGITMYPHATLDVPKLLAQIETERITFLPGPPTLYAMMLEDPSRAGRDLSSLRLAVTGAASVPATLVRRMVAELGFERVTTCYGLTEGTAVATITRAGDDLDTIAATSGRPLPDIEVRVVDGSGAPLPAGEPGEVHIRGYNVMRGYLDAADATAERVDTQGWLHSGDIGRLDDEGGLTVTDRIDDMFTVGGFNTYPAEIEAVLMDHPAVFQAAVIGVPEARLGQVGLAFVVLRAGRSASADELMRWTRERLANFKVPRRFAFVAELPRNATGKVFKVALRELVAEIGESDDLDLTPRLPASP